MAGVLDFVLRVTDKGSTPLSRVSATSKQTAMQLSAVTKESKALSAASSKTAASVGGLRDRLDTLRRQRDMISSDNIASLRTANREISSLEKQIDKLDSKGRRKGGFLESLGDLGRFATNPLTIASAAIGFAGKQAMSFDEGMAKINITAELDPKAKKQLENDIKAISKRNKFDVTLAPNAFEQIISQVGDVDLSKEIFEQVIRGAKGGFTELSTVSGALAQSMSIIGKGNANAGDILDTFFSAKRVGAGEFKDFAAYLPGLIASGDAIGYKYKEVAGLLAYMTGKGQSAEKATVLIDNLFKVLGRGEIRSEINAAGVATHDEKGQILASDVIFGNLAQKMDSMSDVDESSFLEKLGINDQEAKKAFMVMISDSEKLSRTLREVADSAGATDRALEFSRNSTQQASEVWAAFKGEMLDIGTAVLPVITTGLTILGGGIDVVSSILTAGVSAFSWWTDALKDGEPVVWALTTGIGVLGVLLAAHSIKLGVVSVWNTIATATTNAFTAAMKFANASLAATGWGLALIGVSALAAGIIALTTRTDKSTKAFAYFNAELNKSKTATDEDFRATMNAAEGSEERAAGIAKINEQYGSYLPALLTETSTNDELRGALDKVNIELERKLRNKYRDMMIGAAGDDLNAAETELYEFALSGVKDPEQQAVLARYVTDDIIPGLKSGKYKSYQAEAFLGGRRHDVAGKQFDAFYVGASPVYEYVKAIGDYKSAETMADIRYGAPDNTSPIANPTTPITTSTTPTTPTSGSSGSVVNLGGSGNKSYVDLDKIPGINEKGSSAYGAIMSKISKVAVSGLAASAMLATPMPAQPSMMPEAVSEAMDVPAVVAPENNSRARVGGALRLEKFCDKIEIHIASANGKGYDQIREEVVNVLMEVIDGRV